MVSPDAFAFRLRGCPSGVREAALRDRVSAAFGDITPDDVHIHSLATAAWETPPTKTATLTFERLPSVIQSQSKQGTLKIAHHVLDGSLLLDTEFLGLTPLSEVSAQKHEFEYVLGLSSYAV